MIATPSVALQEIMRFSRPLVCSLKLGERGPGATPQTASARPMSTGLFRPTTGGLLEGPEGFQRFHSPWQRVRPGRCAGTWPRICGAGHVSGGRPADADRRCDHRRAGFLGTDFHHQRLSLQLRQLHQRRNCVRFGRGGCLLLRRPAYERVEGSPGRRRGGRLTGIAPSASPGFRSQPRAALPARRRLPRPPDLRRPGPTPGPAGGRQA
jgi:hypothetical protein